ncbi:unnamed protein product, partial [Dovyalis caffra]
VVTPYRLTHRCNISHHPAANSRRYPNESLTTLSSLTPTKIPTLYRQNTSPEP